MQDILTLGNDLSDLYTHKVFDELGYVPKDYYIDYYTPKAFYNLDFAALILWGIVFPKE